MARMKYEIRNITHGELECLCENLEGASLNIHFWKEQYPDEYFEIIDIDSGETVSPIPEEEIPLP